VLSDRALLHELQSWRGIPAGSRGSALANGDGLGSPDHAVEHRDGEDCLALPTRQGAGAELEARKLEAALETLLTAQEVCLSSRARLLIEDQRAEWRELDRRIEAFDEEFARQARTDEAARLLTTIPGIGPLNATALVAAIGRARRRSHGGGTSLPGWGSCPGK